MDKDIFSRILKFILSTNYYFRILDEVEDTQFKDKKLKDHLKIVLEKMNKMQTNIAIKEFHKTASSDHYINNLELHTEFFDKLCSMNISDIEQFMIDFIENGNSSSTILLSGKKVNFHLKDRENRLVLQPLLNENSFSSIQSKISEGFTSGELHILDYMGEGIEVSGWWKVVA